MKKESPIEKSLRLIDEYLNKATDEEIQNLINQVKKFDKIGPTFEEYLSRLSGNYQASNLSKLTSGKLLVTPGMLFSREKFHGIKLIDDANLNFSLIEVVEATEHPLKKVEEGIRVYRIEGGVGSFTVIREDSSFEQIEVNPGDTILIKNGDHYHYDGIGLKLFEINIKYP